MKKILSCIVFLTGLALLNSCGNQDEKKANTANAARVNSDTSRFPVSMVDNKRDPSCGMPVTAGIGDTVHYKNKVIGFCSKDCKDEFLKDPEKNIAAADMKK